MINPETGIEEEKALVEGDTKPEIFEHAHTFDGELAFVFGGIGQPFFYSFDIEENQWARKDNLSRNIAEIMNTTVLTSPQEIKVQDDMVTKIFMALRPSAIG